MFQEKRKITGKRILFLQVGLETWIFTAPTWKSRAKHLFP